MENIYRYKEFIQKILNDPNKKKYCFIGAGLSVCSGLPTWSELIDKMQSELEANPSINLNSSTLEDFARARQDGDFLLAAKYFKNSELTYRQKQKFFNNEFLKNKLPHSIHHALMRFGFSGILTTNFDHLLEDAYTYIYGHSIIPFMPYNWENNNFFSFPNDFFIAKLHGDASDWSKTVLDEEAYLKTSWPQILKPIIDDQILIIFGIGGVDYLTNKFFEMLSHDTRVYIFMLPEAGYEFKKGFRAFENPTIPHKIKIYYLETKDIELLILSIRNDFNPKRNFHVSPWSFIPDFNYHFNFKEYENQFRDFIFSEKKLAVIQAEPNSGLSSFITQTLQDRAKDKNSIIFKIDGLEYLPIEAYVNYILSKLDNSLRSEFIKIRYDTAKSWDEISEANAIAMVYNKTDIPLIIAIEHFDRIYSFNNNIIDFVDTLLCKTDNNFKLIIASSNPDIENQVRFLCSSHKAVMIKLETATPINYKLQLAQKNISHETIDKVLKIYDKADFYTTLFASEILENKLSTLTRIKKAIEDCDISSLCKLIVTKIINNDSINENILNVIVLFKSPASFSEIEKSSKSNQKKVKNILEDLEKYGLIYHIQSNSIDTYLMSSKIREIISVILGSNQSRTITNNNYLEIGKTYEKKALNRIDQDFTKSIRETEKFKNHYNNKVETFINDNPKLELENNISRIDSEDLIKEITNIDSKVCMAIPDFASALYYYKEGGQWNSFKELVLKLKDKFISHNQLSLLEKWLKEIPSDYQSLPITAVQNDYNIIRTKLSISQLCFDPIRFQNCLNEAETFLKRIKKDAGLDILETNNIEKDILYNEGILSSINRKNNAADSIFHQLIPPPITITNPEEDYDIYLRMIQTMITLGRLKEVEAVLAELDRLIINKLTSQGSISKQHAFQSLATTYMQTSRLSILKMTFYDRFINQVNLEMLFNDAIAYSELIEIFSKNIIDFSGIGIAFLRMAQANYVNKNYPNTIEFAKKAIKIFASYPNNPWRKMSCHLIAAKAFAHLKAYEEALTHLNLANEISHLYSNNDIIWKCELYNAEGLIYFLRNEKDDLKNAESLFIESIEVPKLECPCIYGCHLKDLIKLESYIDNYDKLKYYSEEYRNLNIQLE